MDLTALASALLGKIKIEVPWDDLLTIPADVVGALRDGDTAPLRAHVATALDKAVDLSAIPLVGAMAEHEQAALSVAVVDSVAAQLGDKVDAGDHTVTPSPRRVVALAATVVSSKEEAALIMAMGPIFRATHPAMVAAAKRVLAA